MRFPFLASLVCLVSFTALAQGTRRVISPPSARQTGTTAPSSSPAQGLVSADPQQPGVSSESYTIGAGDTLELNVWKEPTLSTSGIPVRPDGRISLPLLGDLPAAGMTPMALSRTVTDKLKKYINDPLVTVAVLASVPKEIFLIGEIQKTGPVILSPGMTTLQAIAAAGGLSPYAKKKLYILRKDAKGQQKLPFDYKRALRTGDGQGITLVPGDTIVVP